MGHYKWRVTRAMLLKLLGTFAELLIPYVLEHLIDNVAPTKDMALIIFWGAMMIVLAITVRFINVTANRQAVGISKSATYEIRRDLFIKSINLSGSQIDEFGLPSLTSRMTADSYNVQNFIRSVQTLGIRAPILLVGGIIISMTMDVGLSTILCILAPIMIVVVVSVSMKGVPLYNRVQKCVDDIVRVMRENITGIRVVKALSKEDYEMNRFEGVNDDMAAKDVKAGVVMSLPGPIMSLALNCGLTIVVLVGARRVNAGVTQPGVILAFLTYFNMILMGVMGLNRIFMMMSKADASANRIAEVIKSATDLLPIGDDEAAKTDSTDYIVFDDVSFGYQADGHDSTNIGFVGEERQMSLSNISFSIKKGGTLGIIGPTGCGKTTIINLLMRFYDATDGHIFVDGRDVRTYGLDELRCKFGVVFQNDVVFADTLSSNIVFGRNVDDAGVERAARDAMAYEFISEYDDGFEHEANIRGANLSGGQRQRILISRALAANPDILVLDDASSALDYRTDANLRKAIREHHSGTTAITIAQRISSIMSMDCILVMDEGRIIGAGTHDELMKNCPEYVEIYNTQMGEGA